MLNRRWPLALTLVTLAALACSTLAPAGPAPALTPVGITATPRPTRPPASPTAPGATPAGGAAEPAGELPFSLDEADDAEPALLPAFAADAGRLPQATRYVIDVTVTFQGRTAATLQGRSAIRYTNPYPEALDDLVLMLWPNEPKQYYADMTLDRVAVNGAEATPALEHNGLAARLSLEPPLAPGEVVELETEFTVHATEGVENGAARFGLTRGVLLAPSFYPLIPRRVGGEWQADPPAAGGDTTNSDTAYYAYRVSAPAELEIVATGSIVDSHLDGDTQVQALVSGPVRDLALVVGPLQLLQGEVDGIVVNSWMLPTHAREAEPILQMAIKQVEALQALVGPYPLAELDVVDAPGAFGGIEYPGVIFIGVVGDGFAERATVHEVGHQWFYSLIGDDQLLEPWLDEALASYTEVLYAEAVRGASGRRSAMNDFWQFADYSDEPETPIGLPVGAYAGPDHYGLTVYWKGAAFIDTLRNELGDETFFNFLRAYYDRFQYGFATSADFQAVAEETCACELDALFDLWVYEGGPVER